MTASSFPWSRGGGKSGARSEPLPAGARPGVGSALAARRGGIPARARAPVARGRKAAQLSPRAAVFFAALRLGFFLGALSRRSASMRTASARVNSSTLEPLGSEAFVSPSVQ